MQVGIGRHRFTTAYARCSTLIALTQTLRMEFEYISGDREQELYAVELRTGEDVVGFALKTQRM